MKTVARIKTETGGRFRVRRWCHVFRRRTGTEPTPAALETFDGNEWNLLETWSSWHKNPRDADPVLQHVPIGDGYAIPGAHVRGLRTEDVQKRIDRFETMQNLGDE